jgi:hypothetical protein
VQVRSAVAVACAEKNVPVGHVGLTSVVHAVARAPVALDVKTEYLFVPRHVAHTTSCIVVPTAE